MACPSEKRSRLKSFRRPEAKLVRKKGSKAMKKIEPLLSETELSVFRRGRNFHTSNTPKSSSGADYHSATGLECLFGFLHLSGNTERINELFSIIINT